MAEKEVLTLDKIKKEAEKEKDKKAYFKRFIKDETYSKDKKELMKLLADEILKKADKSYNLLYDSLNEGLEPIYFWILDFMKDSAPAGLGLNVWKGMEEFEASVSSGYFGEMGQRSSLMQQKAMEYLGTINNIVKSVLNLIYDLKEFEIKLKPYDELNDKKKKPEEKRSALYALKGVWMDQVDARKGRGSINMLAQDLQFVTLRDAFFIANNEDEIKNLDLNGRVKNVLTIKLKDFNEWKEYSEKEIRKRYNIEKEYLRSQYGTIKLYAGWLKPYLIAAQKLKMRGGSSKGLINPNVVNAFSNMEIEIKLFGKKEITPAAIHQSYSSIELDSKYYATTEVIMKFRSVPSALSGQGGRQYVHAGRTEVTFNAYCLDNVEMEAVETKEALEDLELIEDYIGVSLKQLEDEILSYINPPPKEEKNNEKQKMKIENPFKGVIDGFKQVASPLSIFFEPHDKRKGPAFLYKELKDVCDKAAKSQTYVIYNTYKKGHGMVAP